VVLCFVTSRADARVAQVQVGVPEHFPTISFYLKLNVTENQSPETEIKLIYGPFFLFGFTTSLSVVSE
jgi:hypothetical protein